MPVLTLLVAAVSPSITIWIYEKGKDKESVASEQALHQAFVAGNSIGYEMANSALRNRLGILTTHASLAGLFDQLHLPRESDSSATFSMPNLPPTFDYAVVAPASILAARHEYEARTLMLGGYYVRLLALEEDACLQQLAKPGSSFAELLRRADQGFVSMRDTIMEARAIAHRVTGKSFVEIPSDVARAHEAHTFSTLFSQMTNALGHLHDSPSA